MQAFAEPAEPARTPGPRLHLESCDLFTLKGWGVGVAGAPVTLELRAGGVSLSCEIIRQERADVREALGIEALDVGFEVALPPSMWQHATDGTCCLELFGDGTPFAPQPLQIGRERAAAWLSRIAAMDEGAQKRERMRIALAHAESARLGELLDKETVLALAAHAGAANAAASAGPGSARPTAGDPETRLRSYLEECAEFVVRGWCHDPSRPVTKLEVRCNGELLECPTIWHERLDVSEALGIDRLPVGFEVWLPGSMWKRAEQGCCRLEFLANGVRIGGPVEIYRSTAAGWVAGIARRCAEKQDHGDPQDQYRALLAFEHIRHGELLRLLDADAAAHVIAYARRMRLEEFIAPDSLGERSPEQAIGEDASTLLLWKALRVLNERLAEPGGDAYPKVRAVLEECGLTGAVRERYLRSVIPLLCRENEFLRLRELADFGALHLLERSGSAWEVSVAVAALVADCQLERAKDLLWRIPKVIGNGWLNTECILFAVRHARALEASGAVDPRAMEELRYAVIGLLDSFQGEWHSRQHDLCLVDSMVEMLADLDLYSDYFQRDLTEAAIRCYGLCPAFWQRIGSRGGVLPDRLAEAGAHWNTLRQSLELGGDGAIERLGPILEAVSYFQRHRNPEILVFLRDLVANLMPRINAELTPAARALVETLLASDRAEALRIAAFPLAEENRLQQHFGETRDQLLATLRGLGGRSTSPVYELQCRAAEAMTAARAALAGTSRDAMKRALRALERTAVSLSWPTGGFLGADLLASAYLLAREGGLDADPILMRLDETVRRAIAESEAQGYLPPPVCAALSRLSNAADDKVLRGFLRGAQTAIRAKFGARHDRLFARRDRAPALPAGEGWPGDTLVVIYSCRKYLDTRIPEIRRTWVRDLVARGIPYLVVVGEGDGRLTGDVLALDVSDRYEDLPAKTLRMFEWVFENTDAQYVLKIDDDCFLDVERYFGTLGYRKHLYYGRVIRRGVGDTDRRWHQPKSSSEHARSAIDKSPEPSVYADGGGAYCLFRSAIESLLQSRSTQAGARLIAASFMEDKLVGDLLALAGIAPSDEDYEAYQRRRLFAGAMPIGIWENTFFPSRFTPTKVVHCDTEAVLASVRERAAGTEIWPKKIFPTARAPSIKYGENQLELLSEAGKSARLLRADFMVVSVMRNEMHILSHFLAHYRELGVECFVIVDNCSDDGTREHLFAQPDVVLYSADTEYKHSHYGVAWQQAVMGNHCLGKWVLLADADEFLVCDARRWMSLAELIAAATAEGATSVLIEMVDFYPWGDLAEADFGARDPFTAAPWHDQEPLLRWRLGSGRFSNGPSYVSSLRHRLIEAAPHDFVAQKYALLRYQPWTRLSEGLHYSSDANVYSCGAFFAHFKYHAGFKDKVHEEIRRGQHFDGASEYRRYAAMLAEAHGYFGSEEVSVRFECAARAEGSRSGSA